MQFRPIGKSGINASVIGLGTWAIGGWMWGGTETKSAIKAVQSAIDEGINLIDTAPAYGFGLSEEIVGKAIAGKREKVIIATKCGLVWHVKKGEHFFNSTEKGPTSGKATYEVFKCLKKDTIQYEIEKSLKRLNTDYIDLYQTHWQDSTTPISETMEILLKLKKEGKIRAIGISNATKEHFYNYLKEGNIDSCQEKYSMLDRKQEAELLPLCKKYNIAFLAYSPLANGLLTGKIKASRKFNDGDLRNNNPRFSPENIAKVEKLLEAIKPVADRNNCSIAQVIIAWTLQQPGCTHVLVGAREEKQAEENAKAGTIVLSPNDLKEISEKAEKFGKNIV